MSFSKSVHRYQKWVLGGIVALMALSLVVWNTAPAEGRASGKIVAKFYGELGQVTQQEWNDAMHKAVGFYRWKAMNQLLESNDPQSFYIKSRIFRDPRTGGPGFLANIQPKPEDTTRSAKEMIILRYDARSKSMRVSEAEVDQYISSLMQDAGQRAGDPDAEAAFTMTYFRLAPMTFREMIADALLIRKAIQADISGALARHEDIWRDYAGTARQARVAVAAVDPDALPGEERRIGPEEISSRFELDKERYKVPAKISVEYLMASFDEFKKRAADPTPEQVQKYYDERKREFLKPSEDPKAKEEFKSIDEVREEIKSRIRQQESQKAVVDLVRNLNSGDVAKALKEIEDRIRKEVAAEMKDAPRADQDKAVRERSLAATGEVFDNLRKMYAAKGIELVNGVTTAFEMVKLEPLEKEVGKSQGGSSVEGLFKAPVGEIPNAIYKTDKGFSLLRLARRVESYVPDLNDSVREKIRRELAAEEKRKRADKVANDLVKRITEGGEVAYARARQEETKGVSWQRTGYFTSDTAGDLGLSPSTLANNVKQLVLPEGRPAPSKMEAFTLGGGQVGGDKASWAFVIVVEDFAVLPPDVKEADFKNRLAEKADELRTTRYNDRFATLVNMAEWRDVEGSQGN